jgi:hypothetical protein
VFQNLELKVFASCVEFDVQFIQRPVGINFETKEARCLRLETMINCYKAKHKSHMKRKAEEKNLPRKRPNKKPIREPRKR